MTLFRYALAAALCGLASACTAPQTAAQAGSASPGQTKPAAVSTYAGWFQHDSLQPCGSETRWTVTSADALHARIREAGMSPADPVYVRLAGTLAGTQLRVERIEQVGSPTPIRDCPMRGTTIQSH